MRAIKKIKRIIEKNPQEKAAQIFSKLITCLAEESEFSLKELYELNANEFELAIEVLEEWRLDRFYMGKAKVFDVAQQALEMGSSESPRVLRRLQTLRRLSHEQEIKSFFTGDARTRCSDGAGASR